MDEEMRDLLSEQLAELRVIRTQLDAVEARYGVIAERLGMEAKKSTGSSPALGLGKTLGSVLSKAAAVATGPLGADKKKVSAHSAQKKAATADSGSAVEAGIMDELKNAAVSLLLESSQPMKFEEIYAKLKSSGVEMPAERPKLVVRRLLYSKKYFDMRKGYFFLKEGVRPTSGSEPEEEASATEESITDTTKTSNGDEKLVLDPSARMEGVAGPALEMAAEEAAEEVVTAKPAPAPEPEDPSPTVRKPAGDIFTNRLEAILGTDTRVRVKRPENE